MAPEQSHPEKEDNLEHKSISIEEDTTSGGASTIQIDYPSIKKKLASEEKSEWDSSKDAFLLRYCATYFNNWKKVAAKATKFFG